MPEWDWTVIGKWNKFEWAFALRRPVRGRVQARTKSEARGVLKRMFGLDRLPAYVMIY